MGWVALAEAVVRLAAADYRELKKPPERKLSKYGAMKRNERIREIEKFFRSPYGDLLSGGIAKYILEQLQKETEGENANN